MVDWGRRFEVFNEGGGLSWSRNFELTAACLRLGYFDGGNFGHLKNGSHISMSICLCHVLIFV